MKNKKIFAFSMIFGLSAAPRAFAALGQSEISVTQDMGILSATTHTSQTLKNFDVHEISSQGLKVKEYVSKSGTVFGISWKGNGQPDLSLLLGGYFNSYSKALPHDVGGQPPKRKFRGSQSTVDGGSVIVEKSGHLRAMYGRAFVPGLIPAGVDNHEIK